MTTGISTGNALGVAALLTTDADSISKGLTMERDVLGRRP
jgi:hypothetical protein